MRNWSWSIYTVQKTPISSLCTFGGIVDTPAIVSTAQTNPSQQTHIIAFARQPLHNALPAATLDAKQSIWNWEPEARVSLELNLLNTWPQEVTAAVCNERKKKIQQFARILLNVRYRIDCAAVQPQNLFFQTKWCKYRRFCGGRSAGQHAMFASARYVCKTSHSFWNHLSASLTMTSSTCFGKSWSPPAFGRCNPHFSNALMACRTLRSKVTGQLIIPHKVRMSRPSRSMPVILPASAGWVGWIRE